MRDPVRLVLTWMTGLLLCACQPTRDIPPDLVLVLIGGLRADLTAEEHAAADFYEPLSDLPAVRFHNAYAPTPSPLLSLVSTLSGRYPTQIPFCGVRRDPAVMDELPWCAALPEREATAPSILKLYGYSTALLTDGILGAELLSGEFDLAHHQGQPHANDPTDWTALAATAQRWWLDNDTQPRLLVIAVGDLLLEHKTDSALQGLTSPQETHGHYARLAKQSGASLRALLAGLSGTRPRWGFIAGANGISLSETTGFNHANPVPPFSNGVLLERTLHVPLMMIGDESRVESALVGLTDVAPTLLSLAGAALPAGIPGQDLRTPRRDPWAYSQFGDMRSLRVGDHLLTFRGYIHGSAALDPAVAQALQHALGNSNQHRLHDVVRDPYQRIDLSLTAPERLSTLHKKLVLIETTHAAPPEAIQSPEALEVLRARPELGYW